MWSIKSDRLESVAEHVYGTSMLALAINCEFDLGLDITKIALMLAIHELGECIVGDIAITDGGRISREEKAKLEMQAVTKILSGICNSDDLLELFIEFEDGKTPEARFAYLVDKIECDFQCKFYQETGCTSLRKANTQAIKENVMPVLGKDFKAESLADLWITHDKIKLFADDKLFCAIADYILKNKIFNT